MNIGFYEQVIASTIKTKIAKVVPTDVFVVRPENVQQVQADIDAQVAQVNEEKRIAERQRVNEETNERSQASSDAQAKATSNQQWVDNIVQEAAEQIRDLKVQHQSIFDSTVSKMETDHATELAGTRKYYRAQIMKLVGLKEDDPCDDNCLELIGLKTIALEEEIHKNEDEKTNGGAIAGIIVGAILLLVLLIFCIRMMMMRGRSKDHALVNQSSFRSEVKV